VEDLIRQGRVPIGPDQTEDGFFERLTIFCFTRGSIARMITLSHGADPVRGTRLRSVPRTERSFDGREQAHARLRDPSGLREHTRLPKSSLFTRTTPENAGNLAEVYNWVAIFAL